MAHKTLFIGGTGCISASCVAEAAAQGQQVSVFNRGARDTTLPNGVTQITGDINDTADRAKLAAMGFDTIANFIAFTPDDVSRDIETFSGHTGQYVFISSASAYEKPTDSRPVTEETPLINPNWQYSRDKAACETLLTASDMPFTVVRPSHTMRTSLPYMLANGPTMVSRLRAGKPILVPGDGTSLWTLTKTTDFAVPFARLLGNPRALREAFHITGDIGFTWDAIVHTIAAGVGVTPNIKHVASDTLIHFNPDWQGTLVGDKVHCALFDNSKLKCIAGDFTCETDVAKILADPIRHVLAGPLEIDAKMDALHDKIAAAIPGVVPAPK